MLTEQEQKEKDESTEPTEDESMADAFDFDPEEDPDDASHAGDEDDPAEKDAEKGKKEEEAAESGAIDPKLFIRVGRMNLSDEETDTVMGLGSNEAITSMLSLLESRKEGDTSSGGDDVQWHEISDEEAKEFDPELVAMLKGMNGSTKKAVEQMFSKLSGKYEERIKKMGDTLTGRDGDAFDDAVESLGKDWQPVFGKEGKKAADEQVSNLERLRKAVFSGQYKGSVSRRVRAAAKDVFTEHTNKLTNDGKVEKARNRQGRFLGRPAQRKQNDADLTPRQRAVRNASKFMTEHDMHPEQVADMSDVL